MKGWYKTMKKEDLIAMGLTEEQAKKVMDSLDGNFVTKARFNEVNEENKTLKQSVADRDKQLEDLKKSSGDNAELKKQVGDYLKEKVQQLKKDLIAKAVECNGVKVVVFRGEANVDAIKDLAFQIKGESNTDEKVFFVAGIKDGEKCALMVMLSEQLVSEGLNAGKLVKDAAKLIQGGGGGQPHFATAGGKNVAGLGEAVEHILDAAGLK